MAQTFFFFFFLSFNTTFNSRINLKPDIKHKMDVCTLETITTIVDRLCLVFCVLLVTQLLSNIAMSEMATAWAQNRYSFSPSLQALYLTDTG